MQVLRIFQTIKATFGHTDALILPARLAALIVAVPSVLCSNVFAAENAAAWIDVLSSPNPRTQFEWATRYEHGEGLVRDPRRARILYCIAARRGSSGAQYALGWMYANARGVQRNDALALAWFKLAAEQGDNYAQRMTEQLAGLPVVQPVCVDRAEFNGGSLKIARSDGKERAQIEQWVYLLAPVYGLDPALVTAVIEVESAFAINARSRRNALGVMQLLPATARRFGVRDAFDPVQNLHGGMSYLSVLFERFEGNLELILAAYNAGENAVERYGGIPPFAETRGYVPNVLRRYKRSLGAGA